MDDKPASDDLRITRAVVGVLLEHDLSGYEIWHWLGPVHGNTGRAERADPLPHAVPAGSAGFAQELLAEDEDARCKYRITATGKRRAVTEGWGPVAAGRFRRPGSAADGADEEEEDSVWPPETRLLVWRSNSGARRRRWAS